ncbi:MAG TPA: DMT family transporter [Candidatus Poseidoniales archaeon]|nr:MAG TPA: DMT family transporter [Candidatus Poseidoniales archaeon]
MLIFFSAVFLALHFGSWIWSLDHTSLVHSLLFVTSHPLVVVALMPIIGASVRRGHVYGAIIGFLGASIALLEIEGNNEVTLIGDAAAFLGAITVVGYLMIGRHLRSSRSVPVFIYAFPVTLLAGLMLTIGSISLEGTYLTSTTPELSAFGWTDVLWLPWIAYLSLGPGLCGHTVINTALRWISPIVVSVALIFEPVIGGVIGWAITGDAYLGTWTLIGGPLMLVGAIMVTLEESRKSQNSDTHS